jgi:hypothetical protein
MIIKSYKLLGGEHPETATIKNALASLGVKAPHTGKSFTEAMLLGIAGGLGIGYILWEFKKYASAILVMAFQNKWNYPLKFTANLCNRLGIKPVFKETSGTAAAEKHLKEALENGTPAIAWVDQFHLPYMHLPETLNGCMGWIVTAYGLDEAEDKVLIDDLSKKPLTISREEFAKARARIPSYKNRLLLLGAPHAIALENAIIDGIRDCVNYLGAKSDTFALPAIAKWAKLMTDTKNPKGWPVVFRKRNGLYSTLTSIYEGIAHRGSDGAAACARCTPNFSPRPARWLINRNCKKSPRSTKKSPSCGRTWRTLACRIQCCPSRKRKSCSIKNMCCCERKAMPA